MWCNGGCEYLGPVRQPAEYRPGQSQSQNLENVPVDCLLKPVGASEGHGLQQRSLCEHHAVNCQSAAHIALVHQHQPQHRLQALTVAAMIWSGGCKGSHCAGLHVLQETLSRPGGYGEAARICRADPDGHSRLQVPAAAVCRGGGTVFRLWRWVFMMFGFFSSSWQ